MKIIKICFDAQKNRRLNRAVFFDVPLPFLRGWVACICFTMKFRPQVGSLGRKLLQMFSPCKLFPLENSSNFMESSACASNSFFNCFFSCHSFNLQISLQTKTMATFEDNNEPLMFVILSIAFRVNL